MKILLVCSDGISTSLVENALRNYCQNNKLEYKVSLLGPLEAKREITNFDVILLAPQVAFMINEFKTMAKQQRITTISEEDYNLAHAKNIIAKARELFNSY